MKRNDAISCPDCRTLHTITLLDPSLLVCKQCGAVVQETIIGSKKPVPAPMPDDWSFVQIGTTGLIGEKPFTVVGRCRLQLRNDYKNFWCAEYDHGKCLWIIESFASYLISVSPWHHYASDAKNLRAGHTIAISSDAKLTGEYVEKCEGVVFQGEIGPWKLPLPGFFLVQASSNSGAAAFFFIESKEKINFLSCSKANAESLRLQNTLAWHEWT